MTTPLVESPCPPRWACRVYSTVCPGVTVVPSAGSDVSQYVKSSPVAADATDEPVTAMATTRAMTPSSADATRQIDFRPVARRR